jgi:hypothetical protein
MSDWLTGFLFGCFGGLLAGLLGWFELRRHALQDLPQWFKSPFYWAVTFLMVIAGGGLVIAYIRSDIALKPILAINVGASAPLIVKTLASKLPPVEQGTLD